MDDVLGLLILISLLWFFISVGIDSDIASHKEDWEKKRKRPETEWWAKHTNQDVEKYVTQLVRDESNRDKIIEELSPYIDPDSEYFKKHIVKAIGYKPYGNDRFSPDQRLIGFMMATRGYISFYFKSTADHKSGYGTFDEETAYYLEKILRANDVDPFWVIESSYTRNYRCTLLQRATYAKKGSLALGFYERRVIPSACFKDPYSTKLSEYNKDHTSPVPAEETEALFERWGKEHILCLEMDQGQKLGRQDEKYWGLVSSNSLAYDKLHAKQEKLYAEKVLAGERLFNGISKSNQSYSSRPDL